MPNFREFYFRNCLENPNRLHFVVPRVGGTGRKAPFATLSATKNMRSKPVQLFSKQFRKVRSPKFACRSVLGTSEVGFSKVQRYDPVGGVPCSALLNAQWHWAPPESVKLSPSTGTNRHS
jgi:hypothetical protein